MGGMQRETALSNCLHGRCQEWLLVSRCGLPLRGFTQSRQTNLTKPNSSAPGTDLMDRRAAATPRFVCPRP
jgi:hypothetical protein